MYCTEGLRKPHEGWSRWFWVGVASQEKDENFYSAIKLIPIDFSSSGRQTLSEAKKVSGISKHDSIVSCVDYWEDVFTKADHNIFLRLVRPRTTEPFHYFPTDSKELKFLCIRMEFCENGTLKDWLKNRKSVNVWESIQIFLQLARGIEHIHAHRLIHRDVKPLIFFYSKRMPK